MIIRIALVFLMVGLSLLGYYTGLFDLFLDPVRLKAQLIAWGPWAYLLFILSFMLLQPLPGIVFVIPASMIWPKTIAFLLSMAGGVGAGIIGFAFARFVARAWVVKHLPARFHRFDARLQQNAFQTVVLMRFVFFLAPPVNWVLGLSKVGFWPFVLGSIVGLIPGIAALTFLGGSFFEWLLVQSPWVWAGLGAIIVGLIILPRLRQRRAI